MKKRRIFSIILCCSLLLSLLAACSGSENPGAAPPDDGGDAAQSSSEAPAEPAGAEKIYTLDFSDGNIDFVRVNMSPRKADKKTAIEAGQIDGAAGLAISAPGGGEAHIGISLDQLLEDRIEDVRTIVMDIYAECPDGKFSAVGGSIAAKSEDASIASTNWTVYISTRNPNQAVIEIGADRCFSAGGTNILEFSCIANGPADKGETPAVIWIKSVSFYDETNNGIAINASGAGWAGAENYGESGPLNVSRFELPADERVYDGDFLQYYTFAVDGKDAVGVDDFLPHGVLNTSVGIEFEVDEFDGDTLVFIFFGAYNNWGWQQDDNTPVTYADGKITLMWDDTGFDPAAPQELAEGEDDGLKLRFGIWGVDFKAAVKSVNLLIAE